MKIIELFSGNGDISKAFQARGNEAFRVDWSDKVEAELHVDVLSLTAQDIIYLCGGVPNVIWASPQCTTYSVASIGRHREKRGEYLYPKTDSATYDEGVNVHLWKLIQELIDLGTKYYFVENPRGGYRKASFWQEVDIEPVRHTVTYCQYGNTNMKPTDIFTNHPEPSFKPICKRGAPCHEAAPRGSRTGTQGKKGYLNRGEMPKELCEHIAEISEYASAQA